MGFGKSKLLVSNTRGDSLTIIDLKNNYKTENIFFYSMMEELRNVPTYRKAPKIGTHEVVLGNEPNIIYTTNSYDNSIFKIDIENKKIEDVVYVGCFPTHMQIVDDYIFVTNSDSNSISIIDAKEFLLIENIPVGEKPHDIKLDKKRNRVYVANSNGYSIDVIYLDMVKEERIKLNIHPLHFYLNCRNMYILSPETNGMKSSCISVFNLDNKKVLKEIYIDNVIIDMATVTDNDIIFTTNASDGCLYKVSFEDRSVIDKYFLGGMPDNVLWDGKDLLYITNAQKDCVTVFNYKEGKVEKSIKVGSEPNGIIFI